MYRSSTIVFVLLFLAATAPLPCESKIRGAASTKRSNVRNERSRKLQDDKDAVPLAEKPEEDKLTKEWTNMADGICIYFEQALTNRLLYPAEVSQLIVLEDSLGEESSLDKIDIYGCEHLLRLISMLPKILDQQYQDAKQKRLERMRNATGNSAQEEEEDEGFEQAGSLILAKLQDLARYLQKNQSTLFCSRYRKKNEDELAMERKIQKRQERRLKTKAAVLLQLNGNEKAGGDCAAMET